MARRLGEILLLLAILAGTCMPGGTLAAPGAGRVVLYVNEDNERVQQALGKFRAALELAGVTAKYRIRLHHVVVDFANPQQTEQRIREALLLRPAAIVAPSGPIALSAKAVTREVPIIFASYQNPIQLGLIDSLVRPGGNLTGFTFHVALDHKRLEILHELVPGARTIGVLADSWWLREPSTREIVAGARKLHGLDAEIFVAQTKEDLEKVLRSARAREMDAWYVPYTILPFEEPAALVKMFGDMRKPVVFAATLFVEAGGLASYQQMMPIDDVLKLWATMIGLVLDGMAPGDIPVERPKAFELAVNIDTARQIGIRVPPHMLKRADRIVGSRTGG